MKDVGDAGGAWLGEIDVLRQKDEVRRRLGYLPQEFGFYPALSAEATLDHFAIAYPDLVSVFAGTVLNQTGQAVEVILITMLVYLGISLVTSLFMNSLLCGA